MNTRRVLWVNEVGELQGGAEHYMANTARMLSGRGVENVLLYGGSRVRVSAEMAACFAGAYPLSDPVRQAADIAPDLIYIQRLRGTAITSAFAAAGRPVIRFHHDHGLFCLREHKYRPFTHRVCTKPVGLRCYPCPGFINRGHGPFGIELRRVGGLLAELRANMAFPAHVVGSQYMARHMAEHGFVPERVHVIPLYCQPAPDAPSPASSAPGEYVLYVGALTWGKGLDVLLRAAALAAHAPRVVVVGKGPQEPLFRSLCGELGVTPRVTFLGGATRPELANLYRDAQCVVVPSRQPETFSLVGIEAMSHARAVVASNIGGMTEWLEDGANGLAVPPGDPAALARALERIDSEPETARRMGAYGREQHARRFLPELHIETLITLFERMMESGA